MVKNLPANVGDARDLVRSLDQEDSLEEEIATHSSLLAWRIPWTGEPDRAPVYEVAKSWTRLSTHAHIFKITAMMGMVQEAATDVSRAENLKTFFK